MKQSLILSLENYTSRAELSTDMKNAGILSKPVGILRDIVLSSLIPDESTCDSSSQTHLQIEGPDSGRWHVLRSHRRQWQRLVAKLELVYFLGQWISICGSHSPFAGGGVGCC